MSKIRITPIGTCRIHTPLDRAVVRYPIELDLRRNYGFVHTSDEALQQLRFLAGEKQFGTEVIPLVFRPGAAEEVRGQSWEPADLHIVEISSAKRVLCGDAAVQVNYVYRYFGDFFGSKERSRQFWNFVRGGHREELLGFLRGERAFEMMSDSDRELLTSLSTEQQTFKTVKSDMAEIVDRLGRDRVLFVTHVNALTLDGEVIPSRDRLIRWVNLAGQQLDAAVFDPTPVMMDFGQERALESGGLDLTHFTAGFSDRLYDVLHQDHVAALFGVRALGSELDERTRELVSLSARLESMISGSEFLAGSRELHLALERFPDAAPLLHLRGLVRSIIGDFRGAVEDLSAGNVDGSPSHAMRIALLEALNAADNFHESLSIAEALIRDEVENARIYQIAARAAEALDQPELAIGYAKLAFRLDRADLSSALHALKVLAGVGDSSRIAEWRSEILENIGTSSSGAFELCVWALRQREGELFAAGLPLVADNDKWSAIDLMEEALEVGLPEAIAASVPIAVELGRLAPALAERRAAIVNGAIDRAQALAGERRMAEAHSIARALATLPLDSNRQISSSKLAGEGRRLIRDLVADAREAIGQAQSTGDLRAVVEAGLAVGDVLREDSKSATVVARALQSLGQTDAGLDLLKRVRPDARDNMLVRRWTARLAHSVRDYATALEMYGSLRDDGTSEAAKFAPEIERFFVSAKARSEKELLLLARAGRYDDALRLANAILRYMGPSERVERELARMHKMLRVRLRAIEEGDGELDERELILRRMVRMKPEDGASLRRLALELMRQFRFAEAAECWEKLCEVDPGNESAERNRVRCATLAQRRATASAQVVDIVG